MEQQHREIFESNHPALAKIDNIRNLIYDYPNNKPCLSQDVTSCVERNSTLDSIQRIDIIMSMLLSIFKEAGYNNSSINTINNYILHGNNSESSKIIFCE